MKFLITLLLIISTGYSQTAKLDGATMGYSIKDNFILLYVPVSLFVTDDSDYHVRVRIRRELPIGTINGIEYGYMVEQPFFEYDGYKLPMFWAFSTLYSVKCKPIKKDRIDTVFKLYYTKKGDYYLTIDKMCYDGVIESSEVSITIK